MTEKLKGFNPNDIIISRKLMGISQEELSRRSGLAIMTIQRIEKGENKPRLTTLKKIYSALTELSEFKKKTILEGINLLQDKYPSEDIEKILKNGFDEISKNVTKKIK